MTLTDNPVEYDDAAIREEGQRLREIAQSLGPLIRQSTDWIEQKRGIPPELVDAMYDSGVFSTYLPRELGGMEVHPTAWLDMVEELSYHNGSVGWLAFIQVGNTFLAPDVMKKILAEGRWIVAANVGRAGGKAYKVDGGYRITGRWPFASGCPHATWLSGRSNLYDENDQIVLHPNDGLPWSIVAVWPRSSAILHDTWDGLGLRGTGSGDFEVNDLFVPAEHVNELGVHHRHYDGPLHKFIFNLSGHSANALGIARRAVDEFIALAEKKSARGSKRQQRLGRQQLHEIAVARADVLISSARKLVWDLTTECFESAKHNQFVDYDLRVHLAQALTYSVRNAKEAVNLIFEQAGTSAVFRGHPLEICLRDVITAAQHTLVSEPAYDTVGQYLITRGWPGGPQIDIANSFIMPPHPVGVRATS
jgi:alkylation response protein AidB-like acyl-CoA dehydrogenase